MVNIDYLYNPAAAEPIFAKDYFVDKKLGFSVIERGTILPPKSIPNNKATMGGGVVNDNGILIDGTFNRRGSGVAYTSPPESIQHSSETVIYLGLIHNVWGHLISDSIKSFWFLKSEIFNRDFKNCPIAYVSLKQSEKCAINFRRLLEILEVDLDRIQLITQPTQFENIVIPDESFYLEKCFKFTNEYREMIDIVRNFALKNRTSTSSKKIYYFYGKKQIGEERLAEYFRSKGYEIVSPEKLTLDEQLNLLINCNSFASTIGSSSHNSIFLRNDTETIFIPRSCSYKRYQPTLNQVNSINANYIDSSLSVFERLNSSYCYIISEQLKRFFGDNFTGYEEEDFKVFLQYVQNSMSNGFEVTSNAKKYYAPILSDFIVQLKQNKELIDFYAMPLNWETFQPLLSSNGLSYQTHVGKKGWGDGWKSENQISNALDKNLDIQAIKINFPNHKVYYSVYYNDKEGWSPEILAPEQAGTTGKHKSIFGIRIRLDEVGAKEFDILYRVHKFDDTWTDWAKNGEELLSNGIKLNAIQIKLEPKT